MKVSDWQDNRGQVRTLSAFRETMPDRMKKKGWKPLMTLREFEMDGLPSMHAMFMEDKDVTGYTTCMRTVGVWRYWQKIWRSKELKKHMDAWVAELEVQLMAEGLQKMRKSDSPASAKYLMEKGWDKKAGRPSKADVEREARRQAMVDNDLADDINRLKVIENS